MPPKTPKRVTKPTFKPTDDERRLVEQMCAVGIPQESICLVVRDGIDDKTLRKHFRRELDTAKIKANAKIGGTLFNKAVNGINEANELWKPRMSRTEASSQKKLEDDSKNESQYLNIMSSKIIEVIDHSLSISLN